MNAVNFIIATAVAILAIIVAVFGFQPHSAGLEKADYLRIHIRANSNSECDQLIKYDVKNAVVNALTPLLVDATTKDKAVKIIENNLPLIESVANAVLKHAGYNYSASACVCKEKFPTRQYDKLVLESGFYDALILNLGTGVGNNWWCVVYPPMCFVGGTNDNSNSVQYKSKLAEIINKFFSK